MLKDQSREKTKSLLGLKRKTGLSFETGRVCRPDVTGKKRSAASATTRQKIIEATSNVRLSSTPRPLDIFILLIPVHSEAGQPASAANHVFATFTVSRCRAAIGAGAIYYGKSNT